MGDFDGHISRMEDWTYPLGPGETFTSMLNDDAFSQTDVDYAIENISAQGQGAFENMDTVNQTPLNIVADENINTNDRVNSNSGFAMESTVDPDVSDTSFQPQSIEALEVMQKNACLFQRANVYRQLDMYEDNNLQAHNTCGLTDLSPPSNEPQEEDVGGTIEDHDASVNELMNMSSTFLSDGDDGLVAHHSAPLGLYGEGGGEAQSKKRKIQSYTPDMGASRSSREPRFVFRTKSEVDMMDDGYRWRKYGQKVLRGNSYPRSYYKCASNNCNVRRYIERASGDLEFVLTTYKGFHNHGIPATRNSLYFNSTFSNSLPNHQPPSNSNIHEPSWVHIGVSRSERYQVYSSNILESNPQLGSSATFGDGGTGLPINPYQGQARPMNEADSTMPN